MEGSQGTKDQFVGPLLQNGTALHREVPQSMVPRMGKVSLRLHRILAPGSSFRKHWVLGQRQITSSSWKRRTRVGLTAPSTWISAVQPQARSEPTAPHCRKPSPQAFQAQIHSSLHTPSRAPSLDHCSSVIIPEGAAAPAQLQLLGSSSTKSQQSAEACLRPRARHIHRYLHSMT